LATYDYDLAIVGGGSAGLTAAKVGRFFAEKLDMNNNLTVDHVIGSIHAYPTYSFGVPVAPYDYVPPPSTRRQ